MTHKSPIRKKVEEKEKVIDSLAIQLRKKNDELNQISGMNKNLKDKLQDYQVKNTIILLFKVYKKQNVTKFQVAREEIDSLSKRIDKGSDIQRNLEHEVETLNQKLNEVLVRNYELEKNNEIFEDIEQKVKIMAT